MELPPEKPKSIVAQGYDKIATAYTAWTKQVRRTERAKYTAVLLERLPARAALLELGCGAGVPTTRTLVERFAVTGVDISSQQLRLARQNVPDAAFIQADMMALHFPPASFDAVTGFYTLFHVPREEHAVLLQRIYSWLRPGGLFVATMGVHDAAATFEQDWLGAPMYWSSFDSLTNQQLVQAAGFQLLSAEEETAEEFGELITFLWIVAQKPTPRQ